MELKMSFQRGTKTNKLKTSKHAAKQTQRQITLNENNLAKSKQILLWMIEQLLFKI